jgi:hypothetical protein
MQAVVPICLNNIEGKTTRHFEITSTLAKIELNVRLANKTFEGRSSVYIALLSHKTSLSERILMFLPRSNALRLKLSFHIHNTTVSASPTTKPKRQPKTLRNEYDQKGSPKQPNANSVTRSKFSPKMNAQ